MSETTSKELLQIAKITSTKLGYEAHGIMTAELGVDFGGSGMTIGGYAFGDKVPGSGFGVAFIKGILDACGVTTWEQVEGRTVYVVTTGMYGRALGIQNLPTEPGGRFIFADLAAQYAS